MKIWIDGDGAASLPKSTFVAQGGEGSVYRLGDRAIKIYLDPGRHLLAEKLVALSSIHDVRVVAPRALVRRRQNGSPLGYTMRFVTQAEPLCRFFTRSYKEQLGIAPEDCLPIAEGLAARIRSVHAAGALVVDANDTNFLVGPASREVFAIDVDSYQTPGHPATAIATSIADPRLARTNRFDEGSDWFAFAVLAFQLFTGLHPYKGKHPRVAGADERKARRISAFDPEVRWPRATYPVDVIPAGLAAWLRAVLGGDLRSAPPRDFGAAASLATTSGASVGVATAAIARHRLFEVGAPIRRLVDGGVSLWTLTDREVQRDGVTLGAIPAGALRAELLLGKNGRAALVWLDPQGRMKLEGIGGPVLPIELHGDALTNVEGRVLLHRGERLWELRLEEAGGSLVVGTRLVASVLPHATKLGEGVAVQSLLGATYVSLFPQPGRHEQVHVTELDGREVIAARASGRVASLVVKGRAGLERGLLRVAPGTGGGGGYDLTLEPAESADPLPLVALASGVVVRVTDAGDLEIFRPVVGDPGRRKVPQAGCEGLLFGRFGGKVLCAEGGAVYRMSTGPDERVSTATNRPA
ncbi:MAG: hypothetical protein R3B72_00700 [Polyangiaceae bacterium]